MGNEYNLKTVEGIGLFIYKLILVPISRDFLSIPFFKNSLVPIH